MLHMLDTDISSYIIKGASATVEKHLAEKPINDLCISVMTRAELLYGLKRLPSDHYLQESVRRYLTMMPLLSWDAQAANLHAKIKHQLISSGTPIGEFDMLIAAHALAVDAVLVTNNIRHFERIRLPLMLANWTVEAPL